MKFLIFSSVIILCLIRFTLSKCFREQCMENGEIGCKVRMENFASSAETCCKDGIAFGYAESMKRLGRVPGCYRCDRCVDILSIRNGTWGEWSDWTPCTATCGLGSKTRSRKCDSPAPSKLGEKCKGAEIERENCIEKECPINGAWNEWSDWSQCSVSCSKGTITRTRQCNNPKPEHGGRNCEGKSKLIKECVLLDICPIDGGWSKWSPWTFCSKTCGESKKYQYRRCDNPKPKFGGKMCVGSFNQSVACDTPECPIDGEWSDWSDWSKCSKSCGKGEQVRVRDCSNPKPDFGGKNCMGQTKHFQDCVLSKSCPIDGQWGSWSSWTECSKSCDGGLKYQHRLCNNPEPLFGGKNCTGISSKSNSCNKYPCPIDGQWSLWSSWSKCSATCGKGKKFRTRYCNNPPPVFGGKECSGLEEQTEECVLIDKCQIPVDGGWSSWIGTECSRTCGDGKIQQNRLCNNPLPKFGGQTCTGSSKRLIDCNLQPCVTPIDGGWSSWIDETECSKTCGDGKIQQNRLCNNPLPKFGGQTCTGSSKRLIDCNLQPCVTPIDGGWSSWIDETECSKTCGDGKIQQNRLCNNPLPKFSGQTCTGSSKRVIDCNLQPCVSPIDGGWSSWTTTGCSKLCGGGEIRQTRSCNNPLPAFGGKTCTGPSERVIDCNQQPCSSSIDGQWSLWSIPFGPKEGSHQIRSRTCSNPSPKEGGKVCDGTFYESLFETDSCANAEEASDWSPWHCSATAAHRIKECVRVTVQITKSKRIDTKSTSDPIYCDQCRSNCVLNDEGKWISSSLHKVSSKGEENFESELITSKVPSDNHKVGFESSTLKVTSDYDEEIGFDSNALEVTFDDENPNRTESSIEEWSSWECSESDARRIRKCLRKDCSENDNVEVIKMNDADYCHHCKSNCVLNEDGKWIPSSLLKAVPNDKNEEENATQLTVGEWSLWECTDTYAHRVRQCLKKDCLEQNNVEVVTIFDSNYCTHCKSKCILDDHGLLRHISLVEVPIDADDGSSSGDGSDFDDNGFEDMEI